MAMFWEGLQLLTHNKHTESTEGPVCSRPWAPSSQTHKHNLSTPRLGLHKRIGTPYTFVRAKDVLSLHVPVKEVGWAMISHVAVGDEAHVGIPCPDGCEEGNVVLCVPGLSAVLHRTSGLLVNITKVALFCWTKHS